MIDANRLADLRGRDPAAARVAELGLAAGALLGTQVVAARADYNAFAEFVLRDSGGLPLKQAVIHRVWQLHIEYCWRVGRIPAILAPFGHGKTTQLTIGRIAYELGKDVNLRCKIVCQNDDKAMERAMGVSALISSPRYRLLFPNVREVPKESRRDRRAIARWTQHELFLDRPGFAIDPSVQAAGVLSAGTGGRSDLNFYDDIVDQRNAIDEPALRPKVANNVDNVWQQRLEPGGRAALIGTPWHMADFTHVILERPAWCVLRQWVSEDCRRIEQEVYNAPADYPIPRSTRELPVFESAPVEGSSNVLEIGYEPRSCVLEVRFRDGSRYRYRDVSPDTYAAFAGSTSKGSFFHQVIRDKYAFERLAAPYTERPKPEGDGAARFPFP